MRCCISQVLTIEAIHQVHGICPGQSYCCYSSSRFSCLVTRDPLTGKLLFNFKLAILNWEKIMKENTYLLFFAWRPVTYIAGKQLFLFRLYLIIVKSRVSFICVLELYQLSNWLGKPSGLLGHLMSERLLFW